MNSNHVDASLNRIRTIFEKASHRIESLQVGQKVTATGLAAELANEIGMKGPQLYPVLKFLFEGYPNVKITRGARGGIEKLPVVTTNETNDSQEGESE